MAGFASFLFVCFFFPPGMFFLPVFFSFGGVGGNRGKGSGLRRLVGRLLFFGSGSLLEPIARVQTALLQGQGPFLQ